MPSFSAILLTRSILPACAISISDNAISFSPETKIYKKLHRKGAKEMQRTPCKENFFLFFFAFPLRGVLCVFALDVDFEVLNRGQRLPAAVARHGRQLA